jgi:hypothetical protein
VILIFDRPRSGWNVACDHHRDRFQTRTAPPSAGLGGVVCPGSAGAAAGCSSSVRDLPAPLPAARRPVLLPGSCPLWRRGAAAAIPASANISQVPRAASWRTGRRAVGISGAPRRSAACSTRLCPRSGDLPLLNRGVARFLRTTPVDIRADNSRIAYAVLAVPDSHLEPAKPRRRLPKTSAGAFLLPPQLADSSGCFQSASIINRYISNFTFFLTRGFRCDSNAA